MPERSYYEVMMLHPTATHEVIAAVYRVLAKQFHPDHAGPEGSARMALLNEAYGILGNKVKRARYDAIQSAAEAAPETAAPASATKPADARGSAAGATSWATRAANLGRESMPGATNLKFTDGAWSVRPPDEPAPPPATYGEAGPPPSYLPARGSIISFGRYRGWAISQVASYDSNYVEWLSRTMAGRTYRAELQQALTQSNQQDVADRVRSVRA